MPVLNNVNTVTKMKRVYLHPSAAKQIKHILDKIHDGLYGEEINTLYEELNEHIVTIGQSAHPNSYPPIIKNFRQRILDKLYQEWDVYHSYRDGETKDTYEKFLEHLLADIPYYMLTTPDNPTQEELQTVALTICSIIYEINNKHNFVIDDPLLHSGIIQSYITRITDFLENKELYSKLKIFYDPLTIHTENLPTFSQTLFNNNGRLVLGFNEQQSTLFNSLQDMIEWQYNYAPTNGAEMMIGVLSFYDKFLPAYYPEINIKDEYNPIGDGIYFNFTARIGIDDPVMIPIVVFSNDEREPVYGFIINGETRTVQFVNYLTEDTSQQLTDLYDLSSITQYFSLKIGFRFLSPSMIQIGYKTYDENNIHYISPIVTKEIPPVLQYLDIGFPFSSYSKVKHNSMHLFGTYSLYHEPELFNNLFHITH